jgi:hypothetical protein
MIIVKVFSILLLAGFAGYFGNKLSLTNKGQVSFREAYDLTGLPIVTFKQGKNKINLLVDTGSTKSVILPSVLENIKNEKLNEEGTIFGMEGNVINTSYVSIEFKLHKNNYSEKFQVVDMSSAFNAIKQDTGVTIHGILGNSFFENYGYVIDFKDFIAYSK